MKNLAFAFVAAICSIACADDGSETDWPSFRGAGARGIVTGYAFPETWDASDKNSDAIKWQVSVPGLGHSSPVIFGDKLFLTTAVATKDDVPLQVGRGGNTAAADDNGEQTWWVLCYDKSTGEELWRKKAHEGKPLATRHTKATHANASVAVDEKHVVAFFGSEGCYCYDHAGNLIWKQDLGVVDISKYGIGWGYASSPAIHSDRAVLVCDDPNNPYLIALHLSDGEPIWKRKRDGISERSWGTPLIHGGGDDAQVVVNGWPWIVSYDLATGDERWRIEGGGDNPTPSPFAIGETIYITNSHGGKSPIYAIDSGALGNLSDEESESRESILWQVDRGGSYMATPVVWGDYIYLGNTNGVVRCFHAITGEKVYEQRLGGGASVTASLVAADGKIYCPSEDGFMYVLRAGREFEILAKNNMGEPCFATPALSAGTVYVRTTKTLFAIR